MYILGKRILGIQILMLDFYWLFRLMLGTILLGCSFFITVPKNCQKKGLNFKKRWKNDQNVIPTFWTSQIKTKEWLLLGLNFKKKTQNFTFPRITAENSQKSESRE